MKLSFKLLLPAFCALASVTASAQDAAKPDAAKPDAAKPDAAKPDAAKTDARPDWRGSRNPEEFRQRMNEYLKTSLKMTDEEWTAIAPLVEKVQTKQRETMSSRFGGFGGGRSRDGATSGVVSGATPVNEAPRPTATERDALRTALADENTSAADIKAKLAAVRESRKKAAAELEAAREELRKVLTVRQEAILVSSGLLE